jgi:1-acyl-sn-glycerol-3-phosphate acyltransferase
VFLLRGVFRWKLSARIVGDAPPTERAVVVVANHTGYLEPFLVTHAVWKLTGHWHRALAKAELFKIPVLGTLARAAGAVSVKRGSTQGRAVAYAAAVECLAGGGAIYIAPEGTITHDGELLPLRHGAARLALQAGCEMMVVTTFGGQRAWSPVVKLPHVGAHFDIVIEPLTVHDDDDEATLTGRIAAMMLDRTEELRASYAQQDHDAAWWPPYSEPAEPTKTARENIEAYREEMAEAIEHARERMAAMADTDLETRVQSARERARAAADNARQRVDELSDQLRSRADELVELARRGELGDELRQRAEELSRQARLIAEHASELRAELREEREREAEHEQDDPRSAVPDDEGEAIEPPNDAA